MYFNNKYNKKSWEIKQEEGDMQWWVETRLNILDVVKSVKICLHVLFFGWNLIKCELMHRQFDACSVETRLSQENKWPAWFLNKELGI